MKKLSKYKIEELVKLKNDINSRIREYKDGYFYICNIRSHGSVRNENIYNLYELQELCYRYDGEHGIVDVYTNNPNMETLDNYGSIMFVQTISDYVKWEKFVKLDYMIKDVEKSLNEWENRDNIPYHSRPTYSPIYTHEELKGFKDELKLIGPFFYPWNLRNSGKA